MKKPVLDQIAETIGMDADMYRKACLEIARVVAPHWHAMQDAVSDLGIPDELAAEVLYGMAVGLAISKGHPVSKLHEVLDSAGVQIVSDARPKG